MKSSKWSLVLLVASMAQAIPHFELPWMNHPSGEKITYKSADVKNGVFVVEGYFLACAPCNQNAPNVNKLAEDYLNEPRVQVLDVGFDGNDSQYATWIEKHKPNHPVLKDPMGQILLQSLGTFVYPSTYVIDCKGSVLMKTKGTWDEAKRKQIDEAIETALNTICTASTP